MAGPRRVTVVGSANLDHVVRLPRAPSPGETVRADSAATSLGGKGLNQAVAAARAGADTQFIGAVGDDDAGRRIRHLLTGSRVSANDVDVRTDAATGSAYILVEPSGENRIAVVSGANAHLDLAWVEPRLRRHAPQIVLLQLESPRDTVTRCARLARETGARVVLTPAPLSGEPLPSALLEAVWLLALNAREAQLVAGRPWPGAVEALLGLVPAVVVTLGADGAVYADRAGVRHRVPGRRVVVRDTTAAGDTFVGYLAAELSASTEPAEALRVANAAAAISVGCPGAADSIPVRAEVDGDTIRLP